MAKMTCAGCAALVLVAFVAGCGPADLPPANTRTSSGGGRAEQTVSGGDRNVPSGPGNHAEGRRGLADDRRTVVSDPAEDGIRVRSLERYRFSRKRAPAGGDVRAQNGKVTVKAASGVTFLLDGKPFTAGELKPDVPGPADRLSLGEHLQFWVHVSGDRLSIRLRDQNNSLRKEFVGLSWFPVNTAYRVEAGYTPYDKAKTVDVPTILGDIDKATIPGIVSFTLNGQEYKLEPYTPSRATRSSGSYSAISRARRRRIRRLDSCTRRRPWTAR